MIINSILIFAAAASMNVQMETDTRKHPLVEFLPSKVYVLCADQCDAPTPKKQKTVIKRDIKQEKKFTDAKNFEMVNAYLKERQKESGTGGTQAKVTTGKEKYPRHVIKKTETSAPKVKFVPTKETKESKIEKTEPEPVKSTLPTATETLDGNEGAENRNIVSGTKGSMTGALTIMFDFNSSIVDRDEKAKLFAWMEQIGDDAVYYEISGYTCPVNKEQRAVSLSINRAEAIRGIIKGKKKRVVVTTKGLGTGQAHDAVDLRQNRRAEIKAFAANGKPVLPGQNESREVEK